MQKIESAISSQFVTHINYSKPLYFLIFNTKLIPTAGFFGFVVVFMGFFFVFVLFFCQTAPIFWAHLFSYPKKVLYSYYVAVADIIILGRDNSQKYLEKTMMP